MIFNTIIFILGLTKLCHLTKKLLRGTERHTCTYTAMIPSSSPQKKFAGTCNSTESLPVGTSVTTEKRIYVVVIHSFFLDLRAVLHEGHAVT
jgi:hypothetical protein